MSEMAISPRTCFRAEHSSSSSLFQSVGAIELGNVITFAYLTLCISI